MPKAIFHFCLMPMALLCLAMAARAETIVLAFDERGNVLAWCKDAECAGFMDRVKICRGEVSIVATIGTDSD